MTLMNDEMRIVIFVVSSHRSFKITPASSSRMTTLFTQGLVNVIHIVELGVDDIGTKASLPNLPIESGKA